ncbi:TatD family hydrolase [bacterium]|nr:TatD family hydrolase [bacterium]
MSIWIDTHAHLSSDAFVDHVPEVIDRARLAGVAHIVVIGTNLADSRRALELARQYPMLSPTVGTHPNNILEQTPQDLDSVQELAADPRVVGIGETGLDRYWKTVPFDQQEASFARHLHRSSELGKPVVIHCRDAEEPTLRLLRAHADRTGQPISGVMHSFVGGLEMAETCLELGLYISLAGMVTFKKNQSLRELAAAIPLDRLLVETDSPYLSPEPKRGQSNEPAYVVWTGKCIAQARHVDEETIAQATSANARRLFHLPDETRSLSSQETDAS